MNPRRSAVAGLVWAAMIFVGGTAQAETITSRTSDFTLSFSDTQAFSDATVLYAPSFAYDNQAAFSNSVFDLSLFSDATNLAYYANGGITISPPTAPSPPYTSPEPIAVSGLADQANAGSWGVSYNTGFSGGLISQGTLGGLATLNFDGGGFVTGFNTLDFYIFVRILNDWTNLGTATGDLDILGVATGFSAPVVSYDGTYTTISTQNGSYDGANGAQAFLNFALIGGPVSATPLPATLPLFASGLGALGLLGWRRKRKNAAIAA